MARKRSAQADAETSKPKQLRKRLRKAEDQLADAVSKRDRAQARVEALSIIADEVRAQLADADKAAEEAATIAVATTSKKPAAKKPAAAATKPAAKKPAAALQDPAGEASAKGA